MRFQRWSNGQHIYIDDNLMLGVGGEARIYGVTDPPDMAAKIYHEFQDEYRHKLMAMVNNPPDDPMASQGHISIAWPIDILCHIGNRDQVVGFLMPRIEGMSPIFKFYNPKLRRKQCPLFSYRYLHPLQRSTRFT